MRFYTRKEAKEKIEIIYKNQDPIKTGLTLPIRNGQTFNVYSIPIEYLAPNVLNDRISWKIREYEAENNRKLDSDNEQDIEFVYEMVEKESPIDNKRTLKDLAEKGQQMDGIITKDGIIIDGNRRATLLRNLFKGEATKFGKNLEDFRFFKAIILTEDIDSNEIMALETRVQIGEDKKLDYNRICLYLKVDNLLNAGYNITQIANYMATNESDISDKKQVFKLMNEYLEFIGKPNHFTLLDGLEDQFISTRTIFKKMDNGTYSTYDWEYSDADVADFKQVCYDYMRAKYEGKDYRNILVGKSNKTDGVFIKKEVWKDFYNKHEKIVDDANPKNEHDWEELGKKEFVNNLNEAARKLDDTIREIDISSIVSSIQSKVKRLKELLSEKKKISSTDIKYLKQISSDINEITLDNK